MTQIRTIGDLIRLFDSAEANPVEVAGYGREATHKGYLSWFLNTRRWPDAKTFLNALIQDACAKSRVAQLADAEDFRTEYEQKYGSGKIDLLVLGETASGKHFKIPIELKADSEARSDQLKAFSEEAAKSDPAVPCLLFLLGTASVKNDEPTNFANLAIYSPEDILRILSRHLESAPQAVADWAQALELEVGRKALAMEVYCDWKRSARTEKENDNRWRCGYRSDKNVYYYLYHHLATEFRIRGLDLDWSIYDGGYNAVMQFKKENSIPLTGHKGVECFFEFNDDRFVLKAQNDDHSDLRELIGDLRKKIFSFQEANPSLPKPQGPARNIYTRKWIEVVHWEGIGSFVDRGGKPGFDIEGSVGWFNAILEAFGLRRHGKDLVNFLVPMCVRDSSRVVDVIFRNAPFW
jgi:hypothetical protein